MPDALHEHSQAEHTGAGHPEAEHTDAVLPADRGPGMDKATVDALGKVSEALEVVEHARGHLYAFHRLCGTADLTLGEAVDALRDAGHTDLADRLDTELVGRNILEGRWSFQVVEEYDDGYYTAFKELERTARDQLAGGERHVFEAHMKEERRTHGRRHHEPAPGHSDDDSGPEGAGGPGR